MAQVVFYEKPGCINNRKQKRLLEEAGHQVEARNLLTWPWTIEMLRPFLEGAPVDRWINRTHPGLKAGDITLDLNDPDAVLAALCADPLLIRRPLISVAGQTLQGFDADVIDHWIGLAQRPQEDIETCPRVSQASGCSTEENCDV